MAVPESVLICPSLSVAPGPFSVPPETFQRLDLGPETCNLEIQTLSQAINWSKETRPHSSGLWDDFPRRSGISLIVKPFINLL